MQVAVEVELNVPQRLEQEALAAAVMDQVLVLAPLSPELKT